MVGRTEIVSGVRGPQAIAFAAGGVEVTVSRKRYTACFGSDFVDELRVVQTPSRGKDWPTQVQS